MLILLLCSKYSAGDCKYLNFIPSLKRGNDCFSLRETWSDVIFNQYRETAIGVCGQFSIRLRFLVWMEQNVLESSFVIFRNIYRFVLATTKQANKVSVLPFNWYTTLSEKLTFRTYVYQIVRNVSYSENFAYVLNRLS